MRQIGTIPTEPDAMRFADYLLTLDIPNEIEYSETSGAWNVWVEHDDHLDRAMAELATFTANPSDPRYDAATKQAHVVRKEQTKAQERRRSNFVDVRTRWSQPRQWNVPVTLVLIGISIAVGLATKLDFGPGTVAADPMRIVEIQRVGDESHEAIGFKTLKDSIVKDHQVWRLITPIFLHGGLLHILFNMLWLRDLGGLIEMRRGSLKLAIMVLVIAVTSNLSQYYFGGAIRLPTGEIISKTNPFFGGMSGVVFGLFGYVWLRGNLDPASGVGISRENAILMFIWLAVCFTGIIGPIANAAHLTGLLVGLAFGYVPYALRKLLR